MIFKNDAERAKYFPPEKGAGHNVGAIHQEMAKKGQTDVNAGNIFDAIEKQWKAEHTDSIFLYDLRRGLRHYAVGYVNAGANDFNCSGKDLSPSMMVVGQFGNSLAYKTSEEKKWSAEVLADSKTRVGRDYQACLNEMDDLLYIFKKLKEKGLNQEMIAAYAKRAEMEQTMKKMDEYLKKPEEKRWAKEEKKERTSFFSQVLKGKLSKRTGNAR